MSARTFDSASRTWSGPPPRHCPVCDAELPRRPGKGGPLRYCDAHAPAARAYQVAYYAKHRDELLAYQRQRNGSAPRLDRQCVECDRPFRGYKERCHVCRQRARRAAARNVSRGKGERGNGGGASLRGDMPALPSPSPRTCHACGDPLPEQRRGRPRLYCTACVPRGTGEPPPSARGGPSTPNGSPSTTAPAAKEPPSMNDPVAAQWCGVCRSPRELGDLLLVTPLDGRRPWYVCRPSRVRTPCFAAVPDRTKASIALAVPERAA